MKINFEVDITPEEVKELFEGNMDVLQKAMLEMFMRQMSHVKTPDNDMVAFWQSMAERSNDIFKQYQDAMRGGKPKDSNK